MQNVKCSRWIFVFGIQSTWDNVDVQYSWHCCHIKSHSEIRRNFSLCSGHGWNSGATLKIKSITKVWESFCPREDGKDLRRMNFWRDELGYTGIDIWYHLNLYYFSWIGYLFHNSEKKLEIMLSVQT